MLCWMKQIPWPEVTPFSTFGTSSFNWNPYCIWLKFTDRVAHSNYAAGLNPMDSTHYSCLVMANSSMSAFTTLKPKCTDR